jgi:hypothetical protein
MDGLQTRELEQRDVEYPRGRCDLQYGVTRCTGACIPPFLLQFSAAQRADCEEFLRRRLSKPI